MTSQPKLDPAPPLPFDIEVEQALLGAILVNNDVFRQIGAFLKPEHFYEALHGRIFEAVQDTVKAGRLASPATLRLYFSRDAGMKTVGGAAYLAELCKFTPSVIDAGAFARMIVDYALRRAIMAAADEIRATALDPPVAMPGLDVVSMAEGLIASLSTAFDTTQGRRFEALGPAVEETVKATMSDDGPAAVFFGLPRLDDHTGGMRASEFIIIGGRPGMAKSAFAAAIALENGRAGMGVGFFSLEMQTEAIALRLLCAEAYLRQNICVAHEQARKGKRFLSDADQRALFEAEGQLRALPIWIHEGRKMTVGQLAFEARQLKRAKQHTASPLQLVIVDHLQKIRPERDLKNKVTEMTEITDTLSKLAGELGVPIIALSALNRKAENREDRRPELGDLRESGSIESDADTVLLLYREAYYVQKRAVPMSDPGYVKWSNDLSGCRNELDIIIAKQRHGREGLIRVFFDGPSSAIRDE